MNQSHPAIYVYKRIVQATLYIDTHFSEEIDLGNIADEACFSKFHFLRLFKKIYGKSPHQYLTTVRMEQAKKFLEKGYSVQDACTLSGFDSSSSFSGLFKRYTSLSPSAYQKEYFERQELIRTSPLMFIPNCFAEQKGWKKSNFEEVI